MKIEHLNLGEADIAAMSEDEAKAAALLLMEELLAFGRSSEATFSAINAANRAILAQQKAIDAITDGLRRIIDLQKRHQKRAAREVLEKLHLAASSVTFDLPLVDLVPAWASATKEGNSNG